MADHARVTQVVEEVLGAGTGPARVTQVCIEVISANPPPPVFAGLTQSVIEVLERQADVFVRDTQHVIEVLHRDDDVFIRNTQSVVEVLERPDSVQTEARFSQYVIEVLIPLECPTFPPNLCPGDVSGTRTDGLPYTDTDPAAWGGAGVVTGPRTDGLLYTDTAPAACGGAGVVTGPRTGQ